MEVLPILSKISTRDTPYCIIEQDENAIRNVLVYGDARQNWSSMGLCTSALTGGYFREYLQEFNEKYEYNICLHLDPLRHKFPLPSYDGQGARIDEDQLRSYEAHFAENFSPQLLCNYLYLADEPAVILYDTPNTLQKKVAVAADIGVRVLISTEKNLEKIKTP
jgi:hypothetical protein